MSNLAKTARIFNATTQVYVVDVDDVRGMTLDEAAGRCLNIIDTLEPGVYGYEIDQMPYAEAARYLGVDDYFETHDCDDYRAFEDQCAWEDGY